MIMLENQRTIINRVKENTPELIREIQSFQWVFRNQDGLVEWWLKSQRETKADKKEGIRGGITLTYNNCPLWVGVCLGYMDKWNDFIEVEDNAKLIINGLVRGVFDNSIAKKYGYGNRWAQRFVKPGPLRGIDMESSSDNRSGGSGDGDYERVNALMNLSGGQGDLISDVDIKTQSRFSLELTVINMFTGSKGGVDGKGGCVGVGDIAIELGMTPGEVLEIINNYAEQAPLLAIVNAAKHQLNYTKIVYSIAKDKGEKASDRINAAKAGMASYGDLVKVWRESAIFRQINSDMGKKVALSIWDTFESDEYEEK